MYPRIYPLSETAITIEWGNRIDDKLQQAVLRLNYLLHQAPFPGFTETVPAYASLTIYYQAELIASAHPDPFLWVKNHVEVLMRQRVDSAPYPQKTVSIPVCYEDEFGPDLDFVADAHGISKETVIALHQQKAYKVYMMGFLPGFAYMGTVVDAIATARKQMPRAKVEAGSVGIAGNQTGIYPMPSPGGWQIIGRTPLSLFDWGKKSVAHIESNLGVPHFSEHAPFLLQTGDTVQFYAISKEAYCQIENTVKEIPEPVQMGDSSDAVFIKAGIYSTLQDLGRFGFRAFGVPTGGAMDTLAHSIANALVGNTQKAATIECTMGGLVMQFKKETLIALTGGGDAYINDQPIQFYKPLAISRKDVLEVRFNPSGIRTYVAVQGGFASERVMNSKSMSPIVGIGAPLKKDVGLWFDQDFSTVPKKLAGNLPLSVAGPHKSIRVCQGPEHHWMTRESCRQFYNQKFVLSNRCDRMGYHLQADPLFLSKPKELISTAVTKGTIQLTPSGQLVLLMSDCQTTGGYPRIGQVAAVDLPLLAQLSPGQAILFETISFAEATALYLQQQNTFHALFS